ncbi:hypothetical protein ABK040_010428 [Willaertia magna]
MNWRIRGFINNKSTTDIVLMLKSLIINNNKINKRTFIGFLDIKGAYDNVHYNTVAIALQEFGFIKNQGVALVNILKNHQFCIKIQGELTKSIRRTIGLPQEDPMASILFNLIGWSIMKRFIIENNIHENYCEDINEIAILSYADDFTLVANNYKKLKEYFTSIKKIFNNFGLELDSNKSGFISNSTSGKKTMEIEKDWIINKRRNVEILGYFVLENKDKREKQSKIVDKIRGERFEPNFLNRIDTIIRSAIKIKAGLKKKLTTEIFYRDINEGGFGLTKAESIANNCYIGSFLNYLNHRSKPLRCVFEKAYFNTRNSKNKDYFYEIQKLIRTYCIKQRNCKPKEKVSKIGKFT